MHVCLGSFASILPCPRYVCFSPDSDRTAVSIRCQFDGWRPSLLSGGKSRRIYRIDGRNLTYPSMRRGDRVSSELDARKGSGSMQPNGCTAAAFSAWEIASLKIQQIRQSQPPSLDYFFELMATVRVSFLLGGERFHGRLNRSSVLSDVPAKATRLNRARPGYKVIRLRRLSHTLQLQSSYPRPKSLDLLKRVVAVLLRWKLASSL